MASTIELVRQLRDLTGAGVMDCRRALDENGNDLEKAAAALRQKGIASVGKKRGRETQQGLVASYIHQGRMGALIELNCETDFVARTDQFKDLANEVARHAAVIDARFLTVDDVPAEEMAQYLDEQARDTFLENTVLLKQNHAKFSDKTVQELIDEHIAKLGENIVLRRFVRYQLGGE